MKASLFQALNSINFMAAIMTRPEFNASYPKAINYARIGWVLGHELGHGFDNSGRDCSVSFQSKCYSSGIYFGPMGQFMNETWADNKTRMGFDKMSQCVIDEYNKFCVTDDNNNKYCVNGTRTLGENIADNGGVGVLPSKH